MADSKPMIVREVDGSVTRDRIYCLFDNEPRVIMSSYVLKRYGMCWEEYKAYCNLPDDYPRAAPAYLAEKAGIRLDDQRADAAVAGAGSKVARSAQFLEEKRRVLAQHPARISRPPSYSAGCGPRIVRPVEGSVTRDRIHCLFDNEPRILMAPYIRHRYGMSWSEYLAYCGLPDDYPKAAPAYADQKRGSLGRSIRRSVRDRLHDPAYLEEKHRVLEQIMPRRAFGG